MYLRMYIIRRLHNPTWYPANQYNKIVKQLIWNLNSNHCWFISYKTYVLCYYQYNTLVSNPYPGGGGGGLSMSCFSIRNKYVLSCVKKKKKDMSWKQCLSHGYPKRFVKNIKHGKLQFSICKTKNSRLNHKK